MGARPTPATSPILATAFVSASVIATEPNPPTPPVTVPAAAQATGLEPAAPSAPDPSATPVTAVESVPSAAPVFTPLTAPVPTPFTASATANDTDRVPHAVRWCDSRSVSWAERRAPGVEPSCGHPCQERHSAA